MTDPGKNDQTVLDVLLRQVRDQPDAPAYRSASQVLTFLQVDQLSSRIANGLIATGVGTGDRVACLTRHHVECMLLILAACKIGAVCMPVNWRLAPSEIAYIVDHGEATFMMADAAFIPVLQQAWLPRVKQFVCTEEAVAGLPSLAQWYGGFSDATEIVKASPDDAALQVYSSGTTGLPKGVVLTHWGMVSASRVVAHAYQFSGDCIFGNTLPTFHVAGPVNSLVSLYAGGQAVSFAEFRPAAFIKEIPQYGITHCYLVPSMLQFMLELPDVAQGDYRSLRLISYGAAPISERVLVESLQTFKCKFMQVYGLTEVSGPSSFLLPEDHDPGGKKAHLLRSAGKAIDGTRVRIVDPTTLQDVADGSVGEILLESTRNMKEYWRNPVATNEAFPEGRNAQGGWFHSGGIGYMKEGYLYIHDRVKDMIISGGENVYPAEVENILMQHPLVADAAIIGVPDERWGEAVKACVVLRPGSRADAKEIIDYLRHRLAHFKCPKSVDFFDSLPRNPTGKILKRDLRAPYWEDHGRQVS